MARWRSTVDRGEARDDPAAAYVPLEGSPQATAWLVRSVLQAGPEGSHAYPAGSLRARELARTRLAKGERSVDVVLYALTGVNFYPVFGWLKDEPARPYFADMYPGSRRSRAAGRPKARLLLAADGGGRRIVGELAARLAIRSKACW